MSFERLTGPQRVSTAADRIVDCLHYDGTPSRLTDLTVNDDIYEARSLNHFGLVKVVSDVLAERLWTMKEKYPPYGLPRLVKPGQPWVSLTDLEQAHWFGDVENNVQAKLAALRSAYGSKTIIYFLDELEALHKDEEYRAIVEALSTQDTGGYHINTRDTAAEAYDRISPPTNNAIDVITGLFAVVPEVIRRQNGHDPKPDEIIQVLRNSKRLPILPSLISRRQFQGFLVGITKDNKMRLRPWGWDFDPSAFTVLNSESNPKTYVDFSGGIGSVAVKSYSLDRGDMGDAYLPTVIIDESAAVKRLDEIEAQKQVLTCPARNLIAAMWEDMVDIADKAKIFMPQD